MGVEGDNKGLQTTLRSYRAQPGKEEAMSFMHPVKKSYGGDSFQLKALFNPPNNTLSQCRTAAPHPG